MKGIVCYLTIAGIVSAVGMSARADETWPHPIPCRIEDGENPELFMMTLGKVDTLLA